MPSHTACWFIEDRDEHDLLLAPGHERLTFKRFARSFLFFPGDYTEEVTPVPIPNTEVKLFRANGTAGASLWESRTLPGF